MSKNASSEPPGVARYRKILAEHTKGMSLEALAKRHGVKRRTLVWWRWEVKRRDRLRQQTTRKKRAKTTPPKKANARRVAALLPVRVAQRADVRPARTASCFEILLRSGIEVRVPAGFDAEDLRRLVTTLEAPGC